jgi:SP family general alpha glucoside:H+ symporter-like MFS transporter
MASNKFDMDHKSQKRDMTHLELVETMTQVDEAMAESQPKTSTLKVILGNPKIVALCLFANIGGLMYGFDNLVLSLSLSMPAFQ